MAFIGPQDRALFLFLNVKIIVRNDVPLHSRRETTDRYYEQSKNKRNLILLDFMKLQGK